MQRPCGRPMLHFTRAACRSDNCQKALHVTLSTTEEMARMNESSSQEALFVRFGGLSEAGILTGLAA